MQSSHLSAEAWLGLPDPTTRQGRKHASVLPIPCVLDKEEAMRERTRRRAGLSDDMRGRLASRAQRRRR